jgi:hypothetical protein
MLTKESMLSMGELMTNDTFVGACAAREVEMVKLRILV